MDRKQQLEAMGWKCLMAWQGKIQALQDLSTFPVTNLATALPQLRGWIGDLGRAHQGWLSVTADNAALLDPMLPWHWLDMAWGGMQYVEHTGNESPKVRGARPNLPYSQHRPASQSLDLPGRKSVKQQPVHSLRQEEEMPIAQSKSPDGKEGASDGIRSQHPQPLRKEGEMGHPSDHRNPSKVEAGQGQPRGEKPKEKSPATKEKENWLLQEGQNDLGKNEGEPAPEKQVIFRGLQDFASFIQSPMPPAQFRDETKEKKQDSAHSPMLENQGNAMSPFEELEGKDFHPQDLLDAPAKQGNQPLPFAQEHIEKPWAQHSKSAQPKGEQRAFDPNSQGIGLGEALVPELLSQGLELVEPQALPLDSGEPRMQEGKATVAAPNPPLEGNPFPVQSPYSSPATRQEFASPSLSSLGTALTQLVQSPSLAEALSTQQSSGKGKRPSQYPNPRLAIRPSSASELLQSPQIAEQLNHAEVQQPATATQAGEPSPIPVPPAWSSTVPVLQEPGPELMESILEAMAEQLQRDFERYYGS